MPLRTSIPTRLAALALTLAASLLVLCTGVAHADGNGKVYFTQTRYIAHEDQGELPITIARTDDANAGQVRFGVRHLDAQNGLDLDTIRNTTVNFAPGQSSYTFDVKIIDRGMDAGPVWADAYLYGAQYETLADATGRTYAHGPVNSKIEILRDDALETRNPADLLGYAPQSTDATAAPTTPPTDPLAEARFYVQGRKSPAGSEARRYEHSKPAWASALKWLGDQPGVHRFYFWNTPADPAHTVARYLESVEQSAPNTVVQLSTYSLVHGNCGADTSSPAFIRRYQRWMEGVAKGISNFHVVMFLELDSLITTQCMEHSPAKLHARLTELRDAVQILDKLPHTAIYIDGGAADAVSAPRDARLLRAADVAGAQGFFVNSTHFDWTTKEVAYGQKISRMLGGAHFVVNTGENGQGPLAPVSRVKSGNEVTCNPPGRGLGPMSVQTGYADVDGFLWFTNPGGSSGDGPGCGNDAPPTAVFWAARAVSLVDHADFNITGPREHLRHDGTYVPYDAAVAPSASRSALTHQNKLR